MLARHERRPNGNCVWCNAPHPCDAVTAGLALRDALAEVEHWKVRAAANVEIDRRAGMLAGVEAEVERLREVVVNARELDQAARGREAAMQQRIDWYSGEVVRLQSALALQGESVEAAVARAYDVAAATIRERP